MNKYKLKIRRDAMVQWLRQRENSQLSGCGFEPWHTGWCKRSYHLHWKKWANQKNYEKNCLKKKNTTLLNMSPSKGSTRLLFEAFSFLDDVDDVSADVAIDTRELLGNVWRRNGEMRPPSVIEQQTLIDNIILRIIVITSFLISSSKLHSFQFRLIFGTFTWFCSTFKHKLN
jgi:hypothetical protein